MAKFLPRPGHWMITLKRILALALAATAVWLLTVLAMQASATAALIVAALAAGIALAFVGLRKSRPRARIAAAALGAPAVRRSRPRLALISGR